MNEMKIPLELCVVFEESESFESNIFDNWLITRLYAKYHVKLYTLSLKNGSNSRHSDFEKQICVNVHTKQNHISHTLLESDVKSEPTAAHICLVQKSKIKGIKWLYMQQSDPS